MAVVIGEGAGVVVLEKASRHARSRGATILARSCGYGIPASPSHHFALTGGVGGRRSHAAAWPYARLKRNSGITWNCPRAPAPSHDSTKPQPSSAAARGARQNQFQ